MTVKDFINSICLQKEIPLTRLAAKLDINDKTLYSLLSRNNGMGITLERFMEWLDKLDLQLVIEGVNEDEEYILDGEFEDIR